MQSVTIATHGAGERSSVSRSGCISAARPLAPIMVNTQYLVISASAPARPSQRPDLALMTKYWVLTMIGAIGLAALIHPERLKLLRSPAPWVAIATLAVAMIPHLVWLKQVDFVPLTYAGDVYGLSNRAQSAQLVLGYVGHNLALLAVPVALAALALSFPRPRLSRIWSPGVNAGVNVSHALNI